MSYFRSLGRVGHVVLRKSTLHANAPSVYSTTQVRSRYNQGSPGIAFPREGIEETDNEFDQRYFNYFNRPGILLGTNEERLLSLLVADESEYVISRYLPKDRELHYSTLCDLFVGLAVVKRRPTPLLKAAAKILTATPLPRNKENEVTPNQMITTLNSLASLNFINRALTAKLIGDLISSIDLQQMETTKQCSLLRTLGSLKWRSDELLSMFYNYAKNKHTNKEKIDHNLIVTLIHVTAQLNYKPDVNLKQFYESVMTDECLELIDKNSRKWLNHVWSLTLLGIVDISHLQSVLNKNYIQALENPLRSPKLSHADLMKLLNLKAIATLDYKQGDMDAGYLDNHAKEMFQRSANMERYSNKIKEALNGLATGPEYIRHTIRTPYGFVVDGELVLDEKFNFLPIEQTATLEKSIKISHSQTLPIFKDDCKRCALVNVLFDETITNQPCEPLGNKQIIARIMKNIGYRTIFLPENLLSREKTSADLICKLKELIVTGAKVD